MYPCTRYYTLGTRIRTMVHYGTSTRETRDDILETGDFVVARPCEAASRLFYGAKRRLAKLY